MISQKTDYGKIEVVGNNIYYISFAKEFEDIISREENIAHDILNRGFKIVERNLFYTGGGVQKGYDTYVNYLTGKYTCDTYEYVTHGIWKLKFKIGK